VTSLLDGLVIASVGIGVLLLATRRYRRGLAVAWIPGGGAIGLGLGPPGIYLAIGVFWTLALTLASSAERSPPCPAASRWPGLAFLFCSLVVAALTLNHFLARYVALELVVLCTILVFLVDTPLIRHGFPLWRRYLCFRIGDAGLTVAILLLWRFTGTFDIETMLANGLLMPLERQVLVLLGGLLAVWVKVGLPPFHGWMLDSSALSQDRRAWLAGVALPILGAYLLYRFGPWLVAVSILRVAVAVAGLLILLWLCVKGALGQLADAGPRWLIGHGAVALMLVGTPLMNAYLLTFIPVRLGLCLLAARRRRSRVAVVPRDWATQPGPYGWLLGLANQDERFEKCGLERVSRGTAAALASLSRLSAYAVEDMILEGVNRGTAAALASLSRLSAFAVEGVVLEGINQRVARLAWRAGRALQKRHTGRLRRNLLWASMGLVVLVAAVLTLSR